MAVCHALPFRALLKNTRSVGCISCRKNLSSNCVPFVSRAFFESERRIKTHTISPAMQEQDAERKGGLRRVLSKSLPAIINDAAPYAAACVETALLGHSGSHPAMSSARLAAFAAVAASVAFATSTFNFLTTVVMARVGQALGAQRWRALGREVRTASAAALLLGGSCAALLLVCESALLGDAAGGGGLFSLSAEARAAACALFHLRLCAIPALFVQRVCSGLLGGFQRMRVVMAVNLTAAAVELSGVWWALRGGDNDSVGSLRRCGWAFVASSAVGATASAVLVLAMPPPESKGMLRILPHCRCWRRGGGPSDILQSTADFQEESSRASGTSTPDEFSACSFLRDSGAMMARSFCLQGSVFAMAAVASQLDRDKGGNAILAAHTILMQLWMLESNVVDGFADVGTMLGSKMLGAIEEAAEAAAASGSGAAAAAARRDELGAEMRLLTNRVMVLAVVTGAGSAIVLGAASSAVQRAFSSDPAVQEQLRSVWPLLIVMQVPNAGVFGFDGFIAATRSFAWVRNVLIIGVTLLLGPGLVLTTSTFRTLLALWCSKASLNAWRLVTAYVLIYVQFWRRWGGQPLCEDVRRRQKQGAASEIGPELGAGLDVGLESPLLHSEQ